MNPRRTIICLVTIILFFPKCQGVENDTLDDFSSGQYVYLHTIDQVDSVEKLKNSKNISFNHILKIDTSLYPNRMKFNLVNVKRYEREMTIQPFDHIIEYFASPDDSVRTILYEWSVNKEYFQLQEDALSDKQLPDTFVINSFDRKFEQLSSILKHNLGKPILEDIKDDYLNETNRDDIKWATETMNFYLLMFKRDIGTYREIRLIVYPK